MFLYSNFGKFSYFRRKSRVSKENGTLTGGMIDDAPVVRIGEMDRLTERDGFARAEVAPQNES